MYVKGLLDHSTTTLLTVMSRTLYINKFSYLRKLFIDINSQGINVKELLIDNLHFDSNDVSYHF